jgi:hypothetical protein
MRFVATGGQSSREDGGSSGVVDRTQEDRAGVLPLRVVCAFEALVQFVAMGGRSSRVDGGSSGELDRTREEWTGVLPLRVVCAFEALLCFPGVCDDQVFQHGPE